MLLLAYPPWDLRDLILDREEECDECEVRAVDMGARRQQHLEGFWIEEARQPTQLLPLLPVTVADLANFRGERPCPWPGSAADHERKRVISAPGAAFNHRDRRQAHKRSSVGTAGLPALAFVSPRRLGPIAPGHRAYSGEAIAHTAALGFGIEAGRTDGAPAVQHNGTPGFLGLDMEANHIAPPALITNGRDHRPAVECRDGWLNQNPRLALTCNVRTRKGEKRIAATLAAPT